MTFTYLLLNHARRVQFIVTGEKKAPMMDRIFARGSPRRVADAPPAARVEPTEGLLEWVLDRRAASELEDSDLLA
jgi:6-phosphogluconolactonase